MNQQLFDNAQKMLRVLDKGGVGVIREMGVRGRVGQLRSCLVAVYLSETVGGGNWSVDGMYADAYIGPRVEDCCVVSLELPDNVRQIISDFDSGLYPDLEA